MSNKPNQTKVKVCNHKPGDKWDDGCCGNESVKNNSGITDDDQSAIPEVYRKKNNQVSNEQQAFNSQENTLAEHQE